MIEWLKEIDEAAFLFLNGFHSPAFDKIMWFITTIQTWIPLYALIIFFIFRQFKWQGLWVLLGVAVLITITDQLTSSIMKPFFERLRPCHDETIKHLVHNYMRCGGLYSFVSGHSANSFAIATFVFLLFKKRYPVFGWLFLWATIVAYTRVYLGVHFPGDIIVGGAIGAGLGWVIYLALIRFTPITESK